MEIKPIPILNNPTDQQLRAALAQDPWGLFIRYSNMENAYAHLAWIPRLRYLSLMVPVLDQKLMELIKPICPITLNISVRQIEYFSFTPLADAKKLIIETQTGRNILEHLIAYLPNFDYIKYNHLESLTSFENGDRC
jgi:hypothetical protein